MVNVVNLVRIFCDAYLMFTLPIYVLFLVILIKYRKDNDLNQAFFRQMLSNGIADILYILIKLLGMELAASGFLPEPYIWMGDLSAKIYFLVARIITLAQHVGALWIALNRLIALHSPILYKLVCSNGKLHILMIIVQWIGSTLDLAYWGTTRSLTIDIEPDNKTVLFMVGGPDAYPIAFSPSAIMIYCITSIYFFIFSAALVKTIQRKQWTASERGAFKMAAAGFFICSGEIIAYILGRMNLGNTFAWSWIGMDMFISSAPYSMFIFSSVIRDRFVRLVFGCWLNKKSSSTVGDIEMELAIANGQSPNSRKLSDQFGIQRLDQSDAIGKTDLVRMSLQARQAYAINV